MKQFVQGHTTGKRQHQDAAPRPSISIADALPHCLRSIMSQGGFEPRTSGNDIGRGDRSLGVHSRLFRFQVRWVVTYFLNLFPNYSLEMVMHLSSSRSELHLNTSPEEGVWSER